MRRHNGDRGCIGERADGGGNGSGACGENGSQAVVVNTGDRGGGRGPSYSADQVLHGAVAIVGRRGELLVDANGQGQVVWRNRDGRDGGRGDGDRGGLGNATQSCGDGCSASGDTADQTGGIYGCVGNG